MQEKLDYVIALKTQSMGGEKMQGLLRGIFIGTKKYLFFIPYEGYSATERVQETITLSLEGKTMGEYISLKLDEPKTTIYDFEKYMLEEFFQMVPQMLVLSIDDDCNKFKVKASWLSSNIFYNETDRKMGWKLFVHSLGKDKHKVK